VDAQQETELQAYLNDIAALLLEKKLRGAEPDSTVARMIARTKTWTILHHVNGPRKAEIIQFLHDTGLIAIDEGEKDNKKDAIIHLVGIDLKQIALRWARLPNISLPCAQMEEADLREAQLRGAKLPRSNLSWAQLRWTNLEKADLTDAKLDMADLTETLLRGADLRGCSFLGANLSSADFRGADLRDADLTGANLSGTLLGGAFMKGVGGLSGDQLKECEAKGAIIDEEETISSSPIAYLTNQ
jgi:hypothetical protein